jgi:hypothetical protein
LNRDPKLLTPITNMRMATANLLNVNREFFPISMTGRPLSPALSIGWAATPRRSDCCRNFAAARCVDQPRGRQPPMAGMVRLRI